jgi:two-component system response regulator DegU
MTSILIADDHGIVREGLKRLLEAEADFEVCAEASDGSEVLEQVEKTHPDVVVLDITMPQLGGLETLERLRAAHPDLKVVLLSVHGEAPMVHSAAALGVNGYVLKNGQATEVVSAVRATASRVAVVSPAKVGGVTSVAVVAFFSILLLSMFPAASRALHTKK